MPRLRSVQPPRRTPAQLEGGVADAGPPPPVGVLVQLPQGTRGVDTSGAITAGMAAALVKAGYRFIIRYVLVHGGMAVKPLTVAERDILWAAGLVIGIVQTFRRPSTITGPLGAEDGLYAAQQLAALAAPQGMTLWSDCEGVYPSAAVLLDYENEWYTAVNQTGYVPGLYNGPEPNLNGEQLGMGLLFTRYWKADADMPTPEPRGYCMSQVSENIVIDGMAYDGDVVGVDAKGGRPVFWGPPAGTVRRALEGDKAEGVEGGPGAPADVAGSEATSDPAPLTGSMRRGVVAAIHEAHRERSADMVRVRRDVTLSMGGVSDEEWFDLTVEALAPYQGLHARALLVDGRQHTHTDVEFHEAGAPYRHFLDTIGHRFNRQLGAEPMRISWWLYANGIERLKGDVTLAGAVVGATA